MSSFNILNIFIVLFLAQSSLSHPTDNKHNELITKVMRKVTPTAFPPGSILLILVENFGIVTKHFATEFNNATEYLLKDEALMNNNNPEVIEFKNKLNILHNLYDPALNDTKYNYDIAAGYVNLTNYYFEQPEMECKVIKELLTKYKLKDINEKMSIDIEMFFENVIKMFEVSKKYFESEISLWFDNFAKLNDLPERINSFIDFSKDQGEKRN
ncbi:hypothetical protein FF38_12675, partial [Lucilia cuprina]